MSILLILVTLSMFILPFPSDDFKHSKDLDRLTKRFEYIAKRHIGSCFKMPKIKVVFVDNMEKIFQLKIGLAGMCMFWADTVIIDKEYFYSLPSYGKEFLVFHELGHCILYRRHDNFFMKDKLMYRSIMNNSMFNLMTYKLNRDYYLKELFSKTEKCED